MVEVTECKFISKDQNGWSTANDRVPSTRECKDQSVQPVDRSVAHDSRVECRLSELALALTSWVFG